MSYLDGTPEPNDPAPRDGVEEPESVRIPIGSPEKMISDLLTMISRTENRQIMQIVVEWRADVSFSGVTHEIVRVSTNSESTFFYPAPPIDEECGAEAIRRRLGWMPEPGPNEIV